MRVLKRWFGPVHQPVGALGAIRSPPTNDPLVTRTRRSPGPRALEVIADCIHKKRRSDSQEQPAVTIVATTIAPNGLKQPGVGRRTALPVPTILA